MRFWVTMVSILYVDQYSKFWIHNHMALGQSKPIIQGLLSLTYVQNRGAAFSIMQGRYWFFIIIALLVVAALIYYNFKYSPEPLLQYATGLIVAGTLGNVIDRWFYGAVRDFFSIGWWPVFNVADIAIVAGGTFLMLYIVLNENIMNQNSRKP